MRIGSLFPQVKRKSKVANGLAGQANRLAEREALIHAFRSKGRA